MCRVLSAWALEPCLCKHFTLKLKTKDAPDNLYFRIAQGGFEEKDGSFLSNELAITVKGANPSVEGGDLRVPISFKNGSAEFEVTYEWVN